MAHTYYASAGEHHTVLDAYRFEPPYTFKAGSTIMWVYCSLAGQCHKLFWFSTILFDACCAPNYGEPQPHAYQYIRTSNGSCLWNSIGFQVTRSKFFFPHLNAERFFVRSILPQLNTRWSPRLVRDKHFTPINRTKGKHFSSVLNES